MQCRSALALAFTLLVTAPMAAQEQKQGPGVLRLLPPDVVTEHALETANGRLAYIATAGTLPIYGDGGEQKAAVYYTAYVAKDGDVTNRPLTFVFNGGPGAASAFLHLGLVGPRIVDFRDDGLRAATPRLRDNPDSWLGFTDLVLIDPIGTGWSRAAKSGDGKTYWGVAADAEVLAKVIALYIARNGRTASPKYLLGESYGGFRAAKVARAAQREQGIVMAGIMMVSPMLEGHFQFGGKDFALGAALTLPSLAAAELERRNAFSPEKLAEVERFAMTDYLTTLAGPPPRGDAASQFYGRIAEMTGLPLEDVRRTRGFVHRAFVKSFRARDGKIVSRYDATHAVPDPFPESAAAHGPDPGLDGFIRALGSAMVGYAHNELNYKTQLTYRLLASNISGHWDWGSSRSPPGVSDDLRILLSFDPSFRLLIVHGVSDMVTPHGVSRYVLDHLPPDLSPRAQLRLHRGGHMLYFDDASRRDMTAEARAFYLAR